MQLKINKIESSEICHFYEGKHLILSKGNIIRVQNGDDYFEISLPLHGWKRHLNYFRLTRRALRLDKCNVVPVNGGYVIVSQGNVYRFDCHSKRLHHVLKLKDCRNVMHQSIAVISSNELFLGEYGNNSERLEVPVYRSIDAGRTWENIFTFPAGKIKHVHGCYYDKFENKIWTLSGDFEGECYLLCSDRDFKDLEWIGDGSQTFRACNLFFQEDTVHWIMDSPINQSKHIVLDRSSRRIQIGQTFPGPVWYIKRFTDGLYLAATVPEDGPGVTDDKINLFISENLTNWTLLESFKHDGLPKKLFKFGALGFADGIQNSKSFYMFAEAIKGYDGKSFLCSINKEYQV